MSMTTYKADLKRVIQHFKSALPKAACLLWSMDRGEKDPETGN